MEQNYGYLIIPKNVFEYSEKEKHLTPEELFVFAWLYRHRYYTGESEWATMVSIDGMSQRIKLREREARNKAQIRKVLVDLYQKGYIDCDYEVGANLSYNLLLDIYFVKYNGYYKDITYDIFDKFTDPSEFYVYACIDRHGDKGANIAYSEWESLTGHKKTKIVDIFNKMNSDSYHTRIWKFSGGYYESEDGGVRQSINDYYTRPSKRIREEWEKRYGKGEVKEGSSLA